MTAFAELDLVARTEKLEAAVSEIRKIGDAGEQTERRVETSMSKMARSAARFIAPLAAGLITAFAGRGMVNALDTYENRMLRIDSIITATGGAAGRTSKQLEAQAQSLARATLESVDGIMAAQQTLLTFRNVQGEVFDDTIRMSANMAAALGQNLGSAAMQLGRALEDPVNSLALLGRNGAISRDFIKANEDQIEAMVKSGDIASAQAMILAELENMYGGTAGAVSRLAAAKDSLGQSATNLAIAIGQSVGVGDRLAAVIEVIDRGAQWLTGNLDLAAGGVAGLATAIAAGYIPAVYAAITATGFWTASLVALKYALISTGIGAIAVGLGVAVAWLVRVREATGSWGDAMSLVGDVARESFDRIAMRIEALDQKHRAFSENMRAAFLGAAAGVVEAVQGAVNAVDSGVTSLVNMSIQGIAGLINAAIDGLNTVIELANKVPGVNVGTVGQFAPQEIGSVMGGASSGLGGIADSLRSEQGLARQSAIDMRAYADILNELAGSPLDSVNALREAMSAMSDETVDHTDAIRMMNEALLNPAGGGTGSGGGGAGGADDGFAGRLTALQEQFMTEREVIDAWYDEAQEILADRRALEILGEEEHRRALLQVEELYQQQLAALRGQAHEQTLSEAADFFGAMASVTQQGGEKLNRVTRVLGAVQALINTFVAQSQVLADPTLGFFGKMAAYATIGAAGLGLVGSLRSGGGSSGGGGGGRSSSRAAAATPEPAQRGRFLRVDVRGDGMFADFLRDNIEKITDAVFDESKNGGTTVVVGR